MYLYFSFPRSCYLFSFPPCHPSNPSVLTQNTSFTPCCPFPLSFIISQTTTFREPISLNPRQSLVPCPSVGSSAISLSSYREHVARSSESNLFMTYCRRNVDASFETKTISFAVAPTSRSRGTCPTPNPLSITTLIPGVKGNIQHPKLSFHHYRDSWVK